MTNIFPSRLWLSTSTIRDVEPNYEELPDVQYCTVLKLRVSSDSLWFEINILDVFLVFELQIILYGTTICTRRGNWISRARACLEILLNCRESNTSCLRKGTSVTYLYDKRPFQVV